MKKLLALLLVAGMLALVNVGCGGGTTRSTTTTTSGPATTQHTTQK